MPTIEPRKDKNQKIIGYRAKVRVKGYPPVSATFKKKTDADHWAQRIEAQIREDIATDRMADATDAMAKYTCVLMIVGSHSETLLC